MKNKECVLIEPGNLAFPIIDQILLRLVNARIKDQIPDILLLFSYHSCLAVGAKQLDTNDLLKPPGFFEEQGIFLYKSVRGGGITYHWPGQLACYPVIKLAKSERNIPQYMFMLEETGLRTLKDLGIRASRKRYKTAQIGLWVGNDKIASTGIRIIKWVTSYGMALNLSGDVGPSRYIHPCGLKDIKLTTVAELIGITFSHKDVISIFLPHFQQVFGRQIVDNSTSEERIVITNAIQAVLNNIRLT